MVSENDNSQKRQSEACVSLWLLFCSPTFFQTLKSWLMKNCSNRTNLLSTNSRKIMLLNHIWTNWKGKSFFVLTRYLNLSSIGFITDSLQLWGGRNPCNRQLSTDHLTPLSAITRVSLIHLLNWMSNVEFRKNTNWLQRGNHNLEKDDTRPCNFPTHMRCIHKDRTELDPFTVEEENRPEGQGDGVFHKSTVSTPKESLEKINE